jgi:hypothetical protein
VLVCDKDSSPLRARATRLCGDFINIVGVQNSEKGFGFLLLQLKVRSLETIQERFTMFCRSQEFGIANIPRRNSVI